LLWDSNGGHQRLARATGSVAFNYACGILGNMSDISRPFALLADTSTHSLSSFIVTFERTSTKQALDAV